MKTIFNKSIIGSANVGKNIPMFETLTELQFYGLNSKKPIKIVALLTNAQKPIGFVKADIDDGLHSIYLAVYDFERESFFVESDKIGKIYNINKIEEAFDASIKTLHLKNVGTIKQLYDIFLFNLNHTAMK